MTDSAERPEGEEALRNFLRDQGFSEAAISEFFRGHNITSVGAQEIFPGFVIPGKETVYKDGKVQDIASGNPPNGTIHLEDPEPEPLD